MKFGKSSLHNIAKIRPDSVKRRRVSSYDVSGGNHTWSLTRSVLPPWPTTSATGPSPQANYTWIAIPE